MSTENEQAGLLKQMKEQLYSLLDGYAGRLKVDRLRSYINSFKIFPRLPSQIAFSRLRELKKGPYFTPEVFRETRQEYPPKVSPTFSGRYGYLERCENDIKVHGEDAIAHLILPPRLYNALLRSRIETISQLRAFIENPPHDYTEDYRKAGIHPLQFIRNIGEKGASEIIKALEEFNQLETNQNNP